LKLLLDTHAAIWAVAQSTLLPPHIRNVLVSNSKDIFVSSVTIFEIATKYQLRRPDSPPFSGSDAAKYFRAAGFQFLTVTEQHAMTVDNLEMHHRDPFDRLLVAQAISEPMYLISKDPMIALYDCPRIDW
jgi:PIN domain nuclease of toxin-antitoxin system